jgi:UDP-N-acetylglucosamine acyltransferase
VKIHPSAVIGKNTILGKNVTVGPFSILDDDVVIGDDTVIENNVRIGSGATIGSGCTFFPYSIIGSIPQDLKFSGEKSRLTIGDGNIFREFVTVNRGTSHGGGRTSIGNNNYFMAYTHIAHDCIVGNGVIFGNAVTLAGHVTIDDCANVGAFSGIHQFCRVGRYSFIGGYSVVTKDPIPYSKVVGNRARMYGVNYIGLKRHKFSEEKILNIKNLYRVLFQSKYNTSQALAHISEHLPRNEDTIDMVDFIKASRRGIIK